MQFILEKIAERQSDMAQLPDSVLLWVKFMRIWFFSGVVFIPWWKPARWIVATMVATALVIIASKVLLPDFDTIKAGTIIQLVLWVPLLWYLLHNFRNIISQSIGSSKLVHKLFGLWFCGALLLVLVSTVLNFYNVASWVL